MSLVLTSPHRSHEEGANGAFSGFLSGTARRPCGSRPSAFLILIPGSLPFVNLIPAASNAAHLCDSVGLEVLAALDPSTDTLFNEAALSAFLVNL